MSTFNLDSVLREKIFLVLEIGCNYENDLEKAKEMIRYAAEQGADAVKFQTFIAEKVFSTHAEKFWDIEGCPGDTPLDEFRLMPHLTKNQYLMLKDEAEKAGVIFFSTPEDETSFELLNDIGVPLWKISSMNITHKPLIDLCAATQRPILLSTGASTIPEIFQAVEWIENHGNHNIVIMHCISNYPTMDSNANLRMINHIQKCFPEYWVGYSDHTLPNDGEGVITAAVACGAKVIEKHYTWDSTRPGYDHQISVDYRGVRRLITQIERVNSALGSERKQPIEAEAKARIHARRSVTANEHIPRGTRIEKRMLEIKRPSYGIAPQFLEHVVGRVAIVDISYDTQIKWEMIGSYAEN